MKKKWMRAALVIMAFAVVIMLPGEVVGAYAGQQTELEDALSKNGRTYYDMYIKAVSAKKDKTRMVPLGMKEGRYSEALAKKQLGEMYQAGWVVTQANPELFFLDKNVSIGRRLEGDQTKAAGFVFKPVKKYALSEYEINWDKVEQTQAKIDQAADPVLKKANAAETDYEKLKIIHDYIVKKTSYDLKGPNKITIEGVFLDGKAVCEGYAKAFAYLCDRLDDPIPCVYVTGVALRDGKEIRHAWNYCLLDGKWYMVDTTWDEALKDGEETVRYRYFLKGSDSEEWKEHTEQTAEKGNEYTFDHISYPVLSKADYSALPEK